MQKATAECQNNKVRDIYLGKPSEMYLEHSRTAMMEPFSENS